MTGTLALLLRSLRVDARLLRTHLFRLLFVAMIYFMLFSAQQTMFIFGAPGLRFFSSISYLNAFMISLAGVSFFVTAITEEKEEGTLGLLKMAGISPLAMLLGKSSPRLISAALLLSVQFPFTLLAITLGGVSWQQIFASYCALLAYLVLLANVGLFFSVFSRRSSSASWKMALLLILLFILIPWIQFTLAFAFISGGQPPGGFTQAVLTAMDGLNRFSVWNRIGTILTSGFDESVLCFQVYSNLAAAGIFFGLSWISFNFFTRNADASTSPARGLLFKRTRSLGTRRAWTNALIWKDFHFVAGGKLAMIAKFILYPLLVLAFSFLSSWGRVRSSRGRLRWFDLEEFGDAMMVIAMMIFVVEVSWYASSVFHSEIKWNTLSGIMQLPLSTAEVAYSKVAGCLIGLVPVVSLFIVGALISPEDFGEAVEEILTEPWAWFTFFLLGFFVHLVAFLSLFVKWGALPLAIAVMFMGYFLLITLFFFAGGPSGPYDGDGIAVFLTMVEIGCMVVFQLGIGTRLRLLAAK